MKHASLVFVSLLLSGCVAPNNPAEGGGAVETGTAWPSALEIPCPVCVEPTVAWLPNGSILLDAHAAALRLLYPNGSSIPIPIPTPEEPPASRGESLIHAHGERLIYAYKGGNAVDVTTRGVFDQSIHLFIAEDGHNWTIEHEFDIGTSLPAGTGSADRLWVSTRDNLMVVTWNLNGFQPGMEVVVSDDGGQTFGPTQYFANPGLATLGSRAAISDEGVIIIPQMVGRGDIGGGEHLTPGPSAGKALVYRSIDGENWDLVDIGPLSIDQFPHNQVFMTGADWSSELGFVLAWQTKSGGVWLSQSTDGSQWSDPVHVWNLAHAGVHPFVEVEGTLVTLSLQTRQVGVDGNTMRVFVGAWSPGVAVSQPEQVLEINYGRRGEFILHDLRPDGLMVTAIHNETGDGHRLEFRQYG